MQRIYTLTFRPSVIIPTGNLRLNVGGECKYLFRTFEERQAIICWAHANGWESSFGIDHLMNPNEVKETVAQNLALSCEPFHHPVPSLVDA